MKILLLGEFSGFHNNLKKGLATLGYEAVVATHGDSFKQLSTDIALGDSSTNIYGKIKRKVVPFIKAKQLLNYDIVQFVNSNPLTVFGPNKYLYSKILDSAKKKFLSASGDDPVFLSNLNLFQYHPYMCLDRSGKSKIPKITKIEKDTHELIVKKVDGIIPVLYEYSTVYEGNPKRTLTIPLPISTSEIKYSDNIAGNKLHFFHGLNREFFKGTEFMVKALNKLESKYPNDVKVTVAGKMKLTDYLKTLNEANVILDQCKVYSYAMNSLYAMALGKVVLSGADERSLANLGIAKADCPIINITPDADQIYEQLLMLLDQKNTMVDRGQKSRKYIQDHHEAEKVAKTYLKTWGVTRSL